MSESPTRTATSRCRPRPSTSARDGPPSPTSSRSGASERRENRKALDPGLNSTLYSPVIMKDHSSERPLRAGELARQTGVSKDALRFYERQGLLSRPER